MRSASDPALGLALLLALAPAEARADDAAAQALHDRALIIMAQERYEAACPMLDEVARLLDDSLPARLAAAECHLRSGRLATALARYTALEAETAAKGPRARAAEAHARAEGLRASVAHLVLVVPKEVRALRGLAVRLGGAPVDPATFGEPIPLDRGLYRVEVSAPGRTPYAGSADIARDGETFPVHLAMPHPLRPPRDATAPEPAPPPPEDVSARRDAAIPGGVLLGAGATSLLVGGVSGVLALLAARELKATCQADRCPPSQQAAGDRARSLATLATAELVAGALASAAGITLLALRPTAPRAVDVTLRAAPGALWLTGRF